MYPRIPKNPQKASLTMMIFAPSMFIIALLLLCLASVNGDYLSGPTVDWTYQLPNSGTLGGRGVRRHNGVASSYSGSSVFVTADDGSLHIIKPDDFSTSIVVDAPAEKDTFTECRSGVAVSETNGKINFVVYAVGFSPLTNGTNAYNGTASQNDVKSLVMAVGEDGSVRWSMEVSGYVEGTPVVGITGYSVYVSHNVPTSEGSQGVVTVILDDGGNAVVAATFSAADRSLPFGPLTARDDSSTGVHRDVVFWGESSTDESVGDLLLYVLRQSDIYSQNNGIGNESYSLETFGTWAASLVMKPTVSADLSGLWVGGGSSTIAGFTGSLGPASNFGSGDPVSAGWNVTLEQPDWDPSQPLATAMTLSNDSGLIYVSDSSFNFVCIDAATGNVQWSDDGSRRSGYMAEPKLSEIEGQNSMVYVIETNHGNVRQHDARDGSINWASDCIDRTGTNKCQDSVEAEFSISSNGNFVYFADIFGKVTALQVATFPAPPPTTSVPVPAPTTVTNAPASSSPTLRATPQPVVVSTSAPIAATTSQSPDGGSVPTSDSASSGNQANSINNPVSSESNDQTLVYSLVGVFAASAIVALAFFALILRRKRKTREAQEEMELQKEAETQRKWREQQRQFEQECRRQELEMLEEVGALPPGKPIPAPTTPKRPHKKSNETQDRTPPTLTSIEEFADEDASLTAAVVEEDLDGNVMPNGYELNSNVSAVSFLGRKSVGTDKTSRKPDDQPNKASSFSYLPMALAASFDQVMNKSVHGSRPGGNNPASKEAINGGEALNFETNSEDRPWIRIVGRADDDSSIGSESLFIEDDMSVRSGTVSKQYGDDSSQPGSISTKQEPHNDPWSTIMSTIIQAEQRFFNPSMSQSPTPSVGSTVPPTSAPAKAETQALPVAKAEPQSRAEKVETATPVTMKVETRSPPTATSKSATTLATMAEIQTEERQALANQSQLPAMATSDTPFDELPFDEAPAQTSSPPANQPPRSIEL